MATIEEMRSKQDNDSLTTRISNGEPTSGNTAILYCIHPAWNGYAPSERHSPDDVVLRLTNGFNQDILWATADGQLHFGEQALAGLTRHVLKALERIVGPFAPGQAYGIVQPPEQPQTWNCRQCACYVQVHAGITQEIISHGLCAACWQKHQDQRTEEFAAKVAVLEAMANAGPIEAMSPEQFAAATEKLSREEIKTLLAPKPASARNPFEKFKPLE